MISNQSIISSSSQLTLNHLELIRLKLINSSSVFSGYHSTPHIKLNSLNHHHQQPKHPHPPFIQAQAQNHCHFQLGVNSRLSNLIHHALQNGHLDPIEFNNLAAISSSCQDDLINLAFGSLILNDHKQAKYWMARLEPQSVDRQDFYPNLFTICGLIGRGMGMMRRVVRSIQSSHPTSNQPSSQAQRIMEVYIQNLIRWSQIDRAWSYLTLFDLGPSVDLSYEAQLIGTQFVKKVARLKKPAQLANRTWKASAMTYANLRGMDQCMALILCARASIPKTIDNDLNADELKSSPLSWATGNPITTSVISKSIYQKNGPVGLAKFLANLNQDQTQSNRMLLSAWLDILLFCVRPSLEPSELAEQLELLDKFGLLGERELEKYLSYTRKWLEDQVGFQLRSSLARPSLDPRPDLVQPGRPVLSIDPSDPRLGYPTLLKLFEKVYHPNSRPKTSVDHLPYLKPSINVMSEMIRIGSLIGTSPEKVTELIDREMEESQSQIRSSHMIGLIWSKIIHQDLVGLNDLIDKDFKFKYKLVLTGLLTTIILGGLIAIRTPQPIIIKFSQKLIEQCPTSSTSIQKNKSYSSNYPQRAEELNSIESYLNLIRVAESLGDLILIKELHEALMSKFGRERVFQGRRPSSLMDYLTLILDVYMKLNEPLLAQTEIFLLLDDLKNIPGAGHTINVGKPKPEAHCFVPLNEESKLLSSGLLRSFLDLQPISNLIQSKKKEEWMAALSDDADQSEIQVLKFEKLLESLRRSSVQINRKIEHLNRLRSLFSNNVAHESGSVQELKQRLREKVDHDWEVDRLKEIEGRLDRFNRAKDLNRTILSQLIPVDPTKPENSEASNSLLIATATGIEDGDRDRRRPPRKPQQITRDLGWSNGMKVCLGLIKKLIDG